MVKDVIDIGKGNLSHLKNNRAVQSASSVIIITDECVAKHWLKPVRSSLSNKKIIAIQIASGEKNKTIETLKMMWKKMLVCGADRYSVVVTLGGGVVCDIGGFAAATFMRGIPVIHIPTTLLAQVDASIGGKTAIDFHGVKNSIGVFHKPSAVIIDVDTLKTLPPRHIVSGMAEIIKHAVIADRKLFSSLSKKKVREIKSDEWTGIISKSVAIKQKIVEQDAKEKNGIRKQLNFGHTVGHAIEALCLQTKNPLLHGEAVAIGMIAETRMSGLAGHIPEKDVQAIASTLVSTGLVANVSGISVSAIRNMIRTDKKNNGKTILWSLPLRIGKVKSDCILQPDVIQQGILSIIE